MHNRETILYATDQKPTDQDIHDRIVDAIFGRRLQPGARLVETDLASLFGVSRTKVRNAIAKLTQDGIVQARRNHGASIVSPTRAEARQVIAFRCMVEPPLAAALATIRPAGALPALRRHLTAEQAARRAGDGARLIRLTGEFHLLLATLHGNALLIRALRDAEALLCLSIVSYGRADSVACLPDEHTRIVAAIGAGDEEAAAALMRAHLLHVEQGMDLHEPAGHIARATVLGHALDLPPRRTPARRMVQRTGA